MPGNAIKVNHPCLAGPLRQRQNRLQLAPLQVVRMCHQEVPLSLL